MCSKQEVSRANRIAEQEQNRRDVERGKQLLDSGERLTYGELKVGDRIVGVGEVAYVETISSNYGRPAVDLVVAGQDVSRFADAPVTIEPRKPDETVAASYVETSARGLIGDLAVLIGTAEGKGEGWADPDQLEALGVADKHATEGEDALLEADERLAEMPLAVKATTTYEISFGGDGAARSLLILCKHGTVWGPNGDEQSLEITGVAYRYSWDVDNEAEIELEGEDRETAEAFGRRVVPELVE